MARFTVFGEDLRPFARNNGRDSSACILQGWRPLVAGWEESRCWAGSLSVSCPQHRCGLISREVPRPDAPSKGAMPHLGGTETFTICHIAALGCCQTRPGGLVGLCSCCTGDAHHRLQITARHFPPPVRKTARQWRIGRRSRHRRRRRVNLRSWTNNWRAITALC